MPTRDYLASPRPRPMSRRGWAILVLAGVVVGILYVLAAASYNAEGGSSTVGGVRPSTETTIIATLEPQSVDPTQSTAVVHVNLGWQGGDYVDRNSNLTTGIRITAETSEGTTTVDFAEGDSLGQFDVTVGLDGEAANYPFDRYEGLLSLSANTLANTPGQSPTPSKDVLVSVQGEGGVNGWDTVMDLPEVGGGFSVFAFSRAFSTQVFALVLIAIALLVSVSALVVALLIFTARRSIEAALLSWCAALLFALPLLRNYMPNAPPVGATIDIFVFLWTIVMAGVALFLLVVAWSRQRRAELEAAMTDGAESAEPTGAPHAP